MTAARIIEAIVHLSGMHPKETVWGCYMLEFAGHGLSMLALNYVFVQPKCKIGLSSIHLTVPVFY